jgi:RHS repeat-associated protein
MVIKKNPGTPSGSAGEVWMVYDGRNRLVMQQDGNMRSNQKWQYIQYDALDRPIVTGFITDAANYNNLSYHTNLAAASIAYPNTASYPNEVLSQTHYDDYTGMSTATTSSLPSTLDATTSGAGNSNFSTTYNASPAYTQPITQTPMTRGLVIWTSTEVIGFLYPANSKYLYAVSFYDNKGRVIQTQNINITGSKDESTTQYDFSGKPLVNVLVHNMIGATNTQAHTAVAAMTYDQVGRLLTVTRSLNTTITTLGSPATTATVTATPVVIVSNSYDELGHLKQKNLGQQRDVNNNLLATPIETLAYDYTIRGWLLGINRAYLSPGYTVPVTGNGNYFGLELGYDKTASVTGNAFTTPRYDGNLTGVSWKSRGDIIDRQYNYVYDPADRMTAANFTQNSSGSSWDHTYLDFSVSNLSYDYNGNIGSMNQNGFLIGNSAPIDQLTYTYTANTNRLQNVVDGANNPTTKLGDFRSSQAYITALGGSKTVTNAPNYNYTDYTYDANGNMLKDLNKDIGTATTAGILYNYLNLPEQITIANNKGNIQYVYDAAGNKLQKITTETNASVAYNSTTYSGAATTTTTYISGFVYKSIAYANASLSPLQYNNVLQFEGNEEGRVRYVPIAGTVPAGTSPGAYVFDYFIKDNLNNVRMVLTDEQQMDVYPAATMEGGTAGLSNSSTLIYKEAPYYMFPQQNDIVPAFTTTTTTPILTSPIPWFANAAGNLYRNYNGPSATAAPVNNNSNLNVGGNATNYSEYVYRLNPQLNPGDNIGPGITLKVMAGDKISIYGNSAWINPVPTTSPTTIAPVLVNTFLGILASPTSALAAITHGGISPALLASNTATTAPLGSILTANNTPTTPGVTSYVKAGVNWILFDDQFRPVLSGYQSVSQNGNTVTSFGNNSNTINIPMPKNGYLYVYCSNESNVDVVFDNLQVINARGPIAEETHLYPDGLTMAGISDRAWNKLQNNYHYQGNEMQNQEFSDGSGLEEYDFSARHYDQQLGVWHNQDPANQYASPYLAMGDNWPNGMDPNGRNFGNTLADIGIIGGTLAAGIATGGIAWYAMAAGGYAGASLESSSHWDPSKWGNNSWKGAITGELVVGAAAIGGEAAFSTQGTLAFGLGANGASIASGAAEGIAQNIGMTELGDLENSNGGGYGKFEWNWNEMFTATVTGAISGVFQSHPIQNGFDNWLSTGRFNISAALPNSFPNLFQGITSNVIGAGISTWIKDGTTGNMTNFGGDELVSLVSNMTGQMTHQWAQGNSNSGHFFPTLFSNSMAALTQQVSSDVLYNQDSFNGNHSFLSQWSSTFLPTLGEGWLNDSLFPDKYFQ